MTDDDLAEHLDPELDAAVIDGTTGSDLPGPVTHRRVAVALVAAGLAVTPLAVLAAQRGDSVRLGAFTALIGCLFAGGGLAALLGEATGK